MVRNGERQSEGWFIVQRELFASTDFRPSPFTERCAYFWSLEQAAYTPHVQWFNGSQYHLEPGEFVTSQQKMADAFDWSIKRVRLFTARMVRLGRWTVQRAGPGAKSPTRISVCNYQISQRSSAGKGRSKGATGGASEAHQRRSRGGEQKERERKERNCFPRAVGEIIRKAAVIDASTEKGCSLSPSERGKPHWFTFELADEIKREEGLT